MTSPHDKGVGEQVRPSVMLLAKSVGIYDGAPSTAHSIFFIYYNIYYTVLHR